MRKPPSKYTFSLTCRRGHVYGPNPPKDYRGSRICLQCQTGGRLCAHCKLRPVMRKSQVVCSRACANSLRLRPLAERFAEYYTPGKPDACWPWTGAKDRDGYGVIGDEKRRQLRAHRIAYERINGAVPEGQNVLHRCDNPPCCNPSHLFVGSVAENNADKIRKGRHNTANGRRHWNFKHGLYSRSTTP